jgi:hypothetical protein
MPFDPGAWDVLAGAAGAGWGELRPRTVKARRRAKLLLLVSGPPPWKLAGGVLRMAVIAPSAVGVNPTVTLHV